MTNLTNQEWHNDMEADCIRIGNQYPTLNEFELIEASENADSSPCDGMSWLDIFAATCGSMAEAKNQA